jgi:hypothetical protein
VSTADIGASDEDGAIIISDEDGATGAALELDGAASLDEEAGGVTATGTAVLRLKNQIRPTMTITAAMMMSQVLRFMGTTFQRKEWGTL